MPHTHPTVPSSFILMVKQALQGHDPLSALHSEVGYGQCSSKPVGWGCPSTAHTLCLRARRHATHVYTEQVHEWVSGCEKGKDERKKTRKKKSNRLSGTMMSRQSQPHLPDLLYARAILVHWDNKQNMVHINKISQVREDHLALSNVFMF